MAEPRLSSYDRLDGREVRAVIEYLGERVDRYLPNHPGLRAATTELGSVVGRLLEHTARTMRRRAALTVVSRVGVGLVVAVALFVLGSAVADAVGRAGSVRAIEWLPVLESGVNDLVFAGIAVWFLLSLPDRVVRRDLIGHLHRLRSMAHIIDMHQMGKDPALLLPRADPTGASPGPVSYPGREVVSPRVLSPRDYALYLDYCSELLSLTSKAAALCAEESTDSLVLDTVSEIETLTTGMSRKIWQKISLLHDTSPRAYGA
ncbi:hypothetical protein DFJ68_0220 [Terracoccus luteus]|uniref:Uncharacterized protein n=1 Tax=Terracoccus luteus TaxID=53356 RepID=A0A495XQM5_9MICO|nr:hypothetical protein [Terracoccus luteus]RKT76820.1 hypothetical protein DFJ68_0220 [Terracoccus luteus]